MTFKRVFDPNQKSKRLQSVLRNPTTLQGLASIPFKKESEFVDKALTLWFELLSLDEPVDKARRYGRLERRITQFLADDFQLEDFLKLLNRKYETSLAQDEGHEGGSITSTQDKKTTVETQVPSEASLSEKEQINTQIPSVVESKQTNTPDLDHQDNDEISPEIKKQIFSSF